MSSVANHGGSCCCKEAFGGGSEGQNSAILGASKELVQEKGEFIGATYAIGQNNMGVLYLELITIRSLKTILTQRQNLYWVKKTFNFTMSSCLLFLSSVRQEDNQVKNCCSH